MILGKTLYLCSASLHRNNSRFDAGGNPVMDHPGGGGGDRNAMISVVNVLHATESACNKCTVQFSENVKLSVVNTCM